MQLDSNQSKWNHYPDRHDIIKKTTPYPEVVLFYLYLTDQKGRSSSALGMG